MKYTRKLLAGIAFCLIGSAQAAGACTSDHFQFSGSTLAITLCDAGRVMQNDGIEQLRLQSHLSLGAKSFDRESHLSFPEGSATPRVIDDIDLAPLGLTERLHITVSLTSRGPIIEHATSLPGPIILR